MMGVYEYYKPGQVQERIFLGLQPSTTLNKLSDLNKQLECFFEDFVGDTQIMFVFFYVHKSCLFDKYLRYNIQCLLNETPEGQHRKVTIQVVSEAVKRTKILIVRLIQGEAEYREIVADGAVVLKDIDTKFEFSILEKSISKLCLNVVERSGLLGVKAIIELFKATLHIETLRRVFNRYNLTDCAGDVEFKALCTIASCANEKLTPNRAIDCLTAVKRELLIPNDESVDCLDIFDVIYESKIFYEFLLARRFYGKKGHKSFRQQYELITAQLQNKASDFEEKILNDLLPAFQFLSPFIAKYDDNVERTQPSFKHLVSEIWMLDTKQGPKQLKNVYQNVHLVLQWFSEVQVRDCFRAQFNAFC